MSAYRYWRLYTSSTWGSAGIVTLGTLGLKSVAGGANLALSGSGTASSSGDYAGYPSTNAFDGTGTTAWASAIAGAPAGKWLRWDFGAGNEKDIVQVVLDVVTGDFNADTKFRSGLIQCSDDTVTWTTRVGVTDLSQTNGTYTFTLPPVGFGNSAAALPRLSAAALGGGYASVTMPSLLASANRTASSEALLPSLTTNASGHDSTGDQSLNVTLPRMVVEIGTGSSSKQTLPSLSAASAGTVTAIGSLPIAIPALTASASATVAGMANAAVTLPAFNASASAGAVCSITLGGVTTQATGTTGSLGRAQVTLPLFQATAIATAQNRGSAAIVLPSMQMGATVSAALILPSLQLTVIGTAVVTATYEAYAVNLSHTPRGNEQPNDEATHYTNFPFTHVVRYKNSYYGANSTGLYLLEGTTDAGTPIPWEVKTAITDFKSPMKKVPEAAYFSGRFGPNSTIRLHVGEKTPITYAFSTPRGQLAQGHRQKFGKGKECQSRYYALSASGTGEADIDGIEPVFHNTTRRI